MKMFVLSHFNTILGPTPIISLPNDLNTELITFIAELMNFHHVKDDFFIHTTKEFNTANQTFEINSQKARGGNEFLLVSTIFTNKNYDLHPMQEVISEFIKQLKILPEFPQLLAKNAIKPDNLSPCYKQLEQICQNFYDSFPFENSNIHSDKSITRKKNPHQDSKFAKKATQFLKKF